MLIKPPNLPFHLRPKSAAGFWRSMAMLEVGLIVLFLVQAAQGEDVQPRASHPAPTPQQIGLPKPAESVGSGPVFGELPSDVVPPLSIYESCLMLMETSRTLTRKSTLAPEIKAGQVDRVVRAVSLYVERVDRAHPTLPYYTWEQVSGDKVPMSGWGTQVFTMKGAIRHVTALSLRVHHGDVEIKRITVIDKNRTKWEFNQPILVPTDQPRPEICFLPLPTRLAEVRITCRRANAQGKRLPRLFIDAGICSVPESAKQAIYYLQLARNDLKKVQLDEAAVNIQKAYALLRKYQSRL